MKLKKSWILIAAVALLLTFVVSGTIAYLAASTGELVNTFTPGKNDTEIDEPGWEEGDKTTKSNVKITNAADGIKVYVRAKVVANWCDKDGNIVAPWKDNITYGSDWVKGSDGYWYYKNPVEPGKSTTNLFDFYTYKSTDVPVEGAHLEMTVLHQSVQAEPTSAVFEFWGVTLSGTTITEKN